MAYEIYKKILTQEEYFNTWDSEKVATLNESLQRHIYHKYLLKTLIMQRDNCTCQNDKCPYCDNVEDADNLTMHHVKWKKNGGEDKLKNGVILCNTSHRNFHRGKCALTFWGNIYKVDKMTEHKSNINWKIIKFQNKQLRKQLSLDEKGVVISEKMMTYLMKFLEVVYDDLFDSDENTDNTN